MVKSCVRGGGSPATDGGWRETSSKPPGCSRGLRKVMVPAPGLVGLLPKSQHARPALGILLERVTRDQSLVMRENVFIKKA